MQIVYNSENNTIEVPTANLSEYLPVWGSGFNNAWYLRFDRETGVVAIVRDPKTWTKIGLTVGLPAFAFGVAALTAYFLCYRNAPTWEALFFVAVTFLMGIMFSILFPFINRYVVRRDEALWPACRFSWSPDGTLTVAERIVYGPKDYSDVALGIVSGGKRGQRTAYWATQFFLFVLTKDKRWRRHLLAVEAMSGRITRTAGKLSEIMHCETIRGKMSFEECNRIRDEFDHSALKAISHEIHRYVGIVAEKDV